MKHFGGHYHTSFVRKHEKLSFLKKHDVQKKSLKIPEMQKIKFWWVFHHKWTLYEAQKIFGAICDIFGGVIITFIYRRYQFSKKWSSIMSWPGRAPSKKKFPKFFLVSPQILKLENVKKKYTSSTVWPLEFNICWKCGFSAYSRQFSPPVGGWRGGNGQNCHFAYF